LYTDGGDAIGLPSIDLFIETLNGDFSPFDDLYRYKQVSSSVHSMSWRDDSMGGALRCNGGMEQS
jgi:hypothetical protein